MQPAVNNRDPLSNPPMVEMENLATATECTGLIPAAVETEDQAEDYAQMMAVHPIKPNQYTNPK